MLLASALISRIEVAFIEELDLDMPGVGATGKFLRVIVNDVSMRDFLQGKDCLMADFSIKSFFVTQQDEDRGRLFAVEPWKKKHHLASSVAGDCALVIKAVLVESCVPRFNSVFECINCNVSVKCETAEVTPTNILLQCG